MTHKYKGFGGFFVVWQMKKTMDETQTLNFLKMETNEKYILKDLYFFSFEYLLLIINRTKLFLIELLD